VTNVNKALLTCLFLTGCFLLHTSDARAQDAVEGDPIAPPLYGIEDIVVDLARFGNEKASANCNTFRREVSDQILSTLQTDGLPARSSMGNDITNHSKISVDLIPEVVTLVPRDKMCVSWVAFNVQSRNAILVPPATYHRDVKLTYWKGGLLVTTAPHAHPRGIKEAIDTLIGQFVRQYRVDQPVTLK